jgi:hypothetical protein
VVKFFDVVLIVVVRCGISQLRDLHSMQTEEGDSVAGPQFSYAVYVTQATEQSGTDIRLRELRDANAIPKI